MLHRHTVTTLLFLAVAAALAVMTPRQTHSAATAGEEHIPADALDAMREGRYLRASLILRDYLAARPDTAASAILLAARAEAGWGDWEQVRRLLEGRTWLDRVEAGSGWHLLGRSQLELGESHRGTASLGRFLEMSPGTAGREQGQALLRRAAALTEQRDFAGAVTAYDAAARLLPQVEDWIQFFAASALAAAGDTAAVRERLQDVDDMLVRDWAWRTEARARRNAGDASGAEAAAQRAAERAGTPARRAAAWTMLGQIRQERGNRMGARQAYLRAIDAAAGTGAALEAARALTALGPATPEEHLAVGRIYMRHGNETRGIAGLSTYIESGRGTQAERDRLLFDIANAQFRNGQYPQAERALLSVVALARDREVAADALHTAARAQYRDGRQAAARETLLRTIRDYPDQPAAARAAYLIADLEHDDLNLDRALMFYRDAIHFAPESPEAGLARMRIGGIAFAHERFDDALLEFQQYRSTHRTGRAYQQATFWEGRTLRMLGRDDEAATRFSELLQIDPFSYYGGLAAEELGVDPWHGRVEYSPPHNDRFVAQVERALARVDLLRDLGWNEAASFEMERVRAHFARFDGALYALAEALNERGFTHQGIAIGREIHRREGAWNARLLRIVYPFPFRNIIMAEARERNVDPFLAAALIRQESTFNPIARSPVGALGLMQVMPQTATGLARRLAIPRFRTELLTQPELNVVFGTTYLADQLDIWGNRLDVVLAAYNAGPGRVARWRRFPEFSDRLLFAERIPFDETRDYVRIVQNNRRIYAAVYGHLLVPSAPAAMVPKPADADAGPVTGRP
jgi:soluble lytic murein transglycosylase